MRRSASRFLAFGLIVPALVGLSAPSASAIDVQAAVITKSFAPDTVALNGSSIATITVTNPNVAPITNVLFSDIMPAGIDLITQTGGTCSSPATGGGMFTINPGTETFSSTSAGLAGGQACTITVQVKGTIVGAHVNTTSPVTASDAPPGSAASATLTVTGETPPVTDPPNPPSVPHATCAGLPATQVGSAASEVIVGTPGNDVIQALGGDDKIIGLGGSDIICGGTGDDKLKGKAGPDRLFGGAGDDVCRGGAGEDRSTNCETTHRV